MYYFAYGSNLHREQMQERCPGSEPVAKAKLEGYRLCFNRVADIVEDEGSMVWGAIYTVSQGDIKNLDRYEGYPNFYDKLDVDVADDQGTQYTSNRYIEQVLANQTKISMDGRGLFMDNIFTERLCEQ